MVKINFQLIGPVLVQNENPPLTSNVLDDYIPPKSRRSKRKSKFVKED